MVTQITIDGVAPTTNIKNFSVQEDATPIEPSSSFGGAGVIAFGMNVEESAAQWLGGPVLVDGDRGKTSGYVRTIDAINGDGSITADSVLSLFNTERTALPYVGTLGGAVQHYCDLVGITNDVTTDPSVASRAVTYPGWKGNAWVYLKHMLVKEQVEMSMVFNRVIVRPLRLLTATLDRTTSQGWAVDNTNAARAIDIAYYNNTYGTQVELYPLTTEEPSIYSIGASERQVITLQLNASVTSVNQPSVQDFVNDESYAGTNGVYAVTGNDNLPITAAQWVGTGGSLTVATTDDPSIIEVTLVGSSLPDYAPYRIAMSAGGGSDYNSLHITGTAVVRDRKVLRIPTGATNVATSDEVGVTVENPFISSLTDAYNLGLRAAGAYAGLNYSVSGSAYGINRSDAGSEFVSPTIADFNAAVAPGTTIATFNTTWSGDTIADFNAYWLGTVDYLFANQLFGNAVGSRVLGAYANFRVHTTTTTESVVTYNASLDTIVSDFNTAWSGATIADFNASNAGLTCQDFSITPLRRN